MDHRQFTTALRRGWLFVLLFVVLGLGASVLYLRTAPAVYTAKTDLYVSTVGGLDVSELSSGSRFAQDQAENLSLIASRERVLQPVVRQLRLKQSAETLGKSVTASVPSNTSMILVEVEDGSPRQAALIANAVSASLVNTTADLLPPAKKGAPALRVQVIQPAVVPSAPSEPGVMLTTLLGLGLGLLVGLGVALALEGRRARRTASRPIEPEESTAAPQGDRVPEQQPASAWSWRVEST